LPRLRYIKTGLCGYHCSDAVAKARHHDRDTAPEKVALDDHVNMEMHDASLGEAGKLIAEVAEAKIFVPADRIDERRDLYLQDVALEAVIRELGLMHVVRP
jgi:hypothetical protein